MKDVFDKIETRLREEITLLEKELQDAIEYYDEQAVFAIKNQLRAFKYALRVIGEETR